MDYGRIISRAWEITWRWKVLWILGFLAALGNGSGGSNSVFRLASGNTPNNPLPHFNLPPNLGALLAGVGCLAFIIVIVLWVLSVMARGGLIAGVGQIEDEGTTSLGSAWQVGRQRFWTLFGIGFLLVVVPAIVLGIIGLIGALGFAGSIAAAAAGNNQGGLAGGLIVGLVACACTFICGVVIVFAVLGQIRIYAERAAILEGMNWTAACGRGWQMLRAHFGPTLVLWLIFLVIGIALAAVIAAVLLPILLPITLAYNSSQAPNWLALPLIGAGLIGVLVGAVIGSVVQVFTSATWTLAYRELTGAGPAAPVLETPPSPAPPAVEPTGGETWAPPQAAEAETQAAPGPVETQQQEGLAPSEVPSAPPPPSEPPVEG
jgi:hypothetical protein